MQRRTRAIASVSQNRWPVFLLVAKTLLWVACIGTAYAEDIPAAGQGFVPFSGAGQVFSPGEAIRLRVPEAARGATRWQLLDYDGDVVQEDAFATGKQTLDVEPIRETGHYRVLYYKAEELLGPSGFVIYPAVDAEGRCPHYLIVPMIGRLTPLEYVRDEIRLLRHSTIGSVRTHSPWDRMEPRRGEFTETPWDTFHRMYQDAGLPIHFTNASCPGWSAPAGRWQTTTLPANLRDLYRFYRHAAALWPENAWFVEAWNEPDIMGNGTGARAASLTKAVALGVLAERPAMRIGSTSPATSTGKQWYQEMTEGNALEEYVDYFGCHRHTHKMSKLVTAEKAAESADVSTGLENRYNPEAKAAAIEDEYEMFRQHYLSYAQAAGSLAGFNTESGVSIKSFRDARGWDGERAQAEGAPVLMALNLHFGLEYSCYFTVKPWSPHEWGWSLLNSPGYGLGDDSPRAAWVSLSRFGEIFGKGTPLGRLDGAAEADRILAFRVSSQTYGDALLLAYWNQFGGTSRLPLPDGMSPMVLDHMGRPVPGEDATVVTWPMKYALLPVEAAKALTLHDERLFVASPDGSQQNKAPCPIVLDLVAAPTAYTVRPISGLKLKPGETVWTLRVHNFSDTLQQVRLTSAATGGNLTLSDESVSLAGQEDGEVEVRFMSTAPMFTQNNVKNGFTQRLTATLADGRQSVLSFNAYPDPAQLPAVSQFPLVTDNPSDWFQEKWDSGKAVFTKQLNGIEIRSNFQPDETGQKIVYARCRLPQALPADMREYDAVVFTLDVLEGAGAFSFVFSDGKIFRSVKFGTYAKGDTVETAIPLTEFSPETLDWKQIGQCHLAIDQIWANQASCRLSGVRVVKWKP